MLMTPAQALALSRAAENVKVSKQMLDIEQRIKNSCEEGWTSVNYMYLHPESKNTLINAGYKVQELRSDYFKISWD